MTKDLRCGDPAALAGYLYGECDADERDAMAAHLAACPSCAEEIATLQATREQLAEWTPPAARLGFRIAAEDAGGDSAAAGSRGSWPRAAGASTAGPAPLDEDRGAGRRGDSPAPWWRWSPLPAWAQAAAAVLLFAF